MDIEQALAAGDRDSEIDELRNALRRTQAQLAKAKAKREELAEVTIEACRAAVAAYGPIPPVPAPAKDARRKAGEKHGGGLCRLDFEAAQSLAEPPADDLLAVNDALDLLAREDPLKAELVKLRCFAGLSHQEAADALGLSRATADRYWAYAKAWLYSRLHDAEERA